MKVSLLGKLVDALLREAQNLIDAQVMRETTKWMLAEKERMMEWGNVEKSVEPEGEVRTATNPEKQFDLREIFAREIRGSDWCLLKVLFGCGSD